MCYFKTSRYENVNRYENNCFIEIEKSRQIISKCIFKTKNIIKMINDVDNFPKGLIKLASSTSLEGQSEMLETREVMNKTEWTKCLFCQNDKSEKKL